MFECVENNLGLMGIDLAEYLKQEYGLMSAASYVSGRDIPIVEY